MDYSRCIGQARAKVGGVSTDWLPLPMAPLMIFMSLVEANGEGSKVSKCPNLTKLMALACKDWAIPIRRGCRDTFSEGVSSVTNVPTVRLEATVGSMNIIKAIRRTRGAAPPTTPAKGGTPPLLPPRLHGCGGWRARKQPLFYEQKLQTPV